MGFSQGLSQLNPTPSSRALACTPTISSPQPSSWKSKERAHSYSTSHQGLDLGTVPGLQSSPGTGSPAFSQEPWWAHTAPLSPKLPEQQPPASPYERVFQASLESSHRQHLSLKCCPGDPHTPLWAVIPLCFSTNHSARHKTQRAKRKKNL